ncbi:MAG: DUF4124 domain-containing protein [Gallionella sp.]|nr:DUF4124 domain-containing protein [Gallionella sp.]
MQTTKLIIALTFGMMFSLPASAKMYKWVDDKGTTHYGETIPPEYANKDRVELNKDGRVMKKIGILTPEERLAKKEADAKKLEQDKLALDQKRHDATLTNTYSNSDEIDLARKRSLQQIEARITSQQSQLKMANTNLTGLQQEAEKRNLAKKPMPESLQEDIHQSQSQVARLQKNLDTSMAEKATVEAKFDADKVRYKELTGK